MIHTLMNKAPMTFISPRPGRSPVLSALMTAWLATATALLSPTTSLAHDYRVGKVAVEHPYAPPSIHGVSTAAVYLRRIENSGDQADRLIAARTPIARAVEFHSMSIDAANVMQMRAQPHIEIPAGGKLELRPGGPLHLMLLDLKRPLKEGYRLPLTLVFERAGEIEVPVWVQSPRSRDDRGAAHAH